MSFNVHARRVRDASLPLPRRVSALSCCVALHRPFGFHGTLAFLELAAGPFHDDEQALLHALDVLEDLRARWQAEAAAYAEIRRAEKRAGRRVPDPGAPNPHTGPAGGTEDLAAGAEHRLRLWTERETGHRADHPGDESPADPLETDVRRLVRACLDGGFGVGDHALLDTCLSAIEARMARSTSGNEHRRWRNLQAAAHLVRVATAGR